MGEVAKRKPIKRLAKGPKVRPDSRKDKRQVVRITLTDLRASARKRQKTSRQKRIKQRLHAPSLKSQALEMRNFPKQVKHTIQARLQHVTSRRLQALQLRIVGKQLKAEKRDVRQGTPSSTVSMVGTALSRKLVVGALLIAQGRGTFTVPDAKVTTPKLKVLPAVAIPINGGKDRISIVIDPKTKTIITKGFFTNKSRTVEFEFNPTQLALVVNGSIKIGSSRLMLGGNLNRAVPGAQIGYQSNGVGLTGTVGIDVITKRLKYAAMIKFNLVAILRKIFEKTKPTLDPKSVEETNKTLDMAEKRRMQKKGERRKAEAEKRRHDKRIASKD